MTEDWTTRARVETARSHQVSVLAHPFHCPGHFQIYLEYQFKEQDHVAGIQSYVTFALVLNSREWIPMSFHVPEGREVPSGVIDGQNDANMLKHAVSASGCLRRSIGDVVRHGSSI
jgi:hypothetical protein